MKGLGDETLRGIDREPIEPVRKNVTIDWTLRENVRAQLRVLVKRILRKHVYPPDKPEKATQTVLEQAELLSNRWAAAPDRQEPIFHRSCPHRVTRPRNSMRLGGRGRRPF